MEFFILKSLDKTIFYCYNENQVKNIFIQEKEIMKKFAKCIICVLFCFMAISIVACGTSKLKKAYDNVYSNYSSYSACFEIGSDNSYISVDTNPYDIDDYYNRNYMDVLKSMNKELGLPDYIYEAMLTTNSLQGKQTETANGITVTWSYHPDRGLQAIYRLA